MAAVSASERDYGGAMGEQREKVHEFDPEWRVDMPCTCHGTRVQGRTVGDI
jgi:hypothetical protein